MPRVRSRAHARLRVTKGVPRLPDDGFFGSEGRLADGAFGRAAGDAAQIESFGVDGIGRAKERTHVIKAADVVEQDGGR